MDPLENEPVLIEVHCTRPAIDCHRNYSVIFAIPFDSETTLSMYCESFGTPITSKTVYMQRKLHS